MPLLPIGYSIIGFYGRNYYYLDNTYYEWAPAYDGYRVVQLPTSVETTYPQQDIVNTYIPGNIFYNLPDGAQLRILDGVEYYWFEGHYFLKTVKNGETVYIVVNPD